MLAGLRRWIGVEEVPSASPPGVQPSVAPADSPLVAESLRAIREDMTKLRDEFAQLQLDWASTLDKMKKWANRQAARERAAYEKAMASMEETPKEPSTPPLLDDGAATRAAHKAQLRQLVAGMRTGGNR